MASEELFYGTSGPTNASILIVGESWGSNEDIEEKPFVGAAGAELRRMLGEAGIDIKDCLLTNVVSARPQANEMSNFFYNNTQVKVLRPVPIRGLFPKPVVVDGLEKLRQLIAYVKPKLIIGFGNYVLWALTNDCFNVRNVSGVKVPTGIGSWRGSQLRTRDENIPLMVTYHPAAILRQWSLRYPTMHDLKARTRKALVGEWDAPPYNFVVSPSFQQVMEALDKIESMLPCKVAADLETFAYQIGCVGLAWSKHDAICIPFWRKATATAYWSRQEEIEIVMRLRRLFSNPLCQLVGQNFLYDAQYISLYWHVTPTVYLDTLIIHHLCWPGTPRGLDYLSSLYCSYHKYWKDEGKSWHPTFSDEQQWLYNCKDCVATFEVAEVLEGLVKKLGLLEQFNFQMQQFHLALGMMLRGVRQDVEERKRLSMELAVIQKRIMDWLEWVIPQHIWPRQKGRSAWYSSPKQIMELFYDVFNLPSGKERSSDDEAMQRLMELEPLMSPICERILALRSINIFRTTFLEARLGPDQRLRCTFDPAGTKTYRWSSSQDAFGNGANLQTIPKGHEVET